MKTKTIISEIVISSFFALVSLIALNGYSSSNSSASFTGLLNKYFTSSASSFTEDTFTGKNIFNKTESRDLQPSIKINLISRNTNTKKQTVYTITPGRMKYFIKQAGSIIYIQGQVIKIDNIKIRKPVKNMSGALIQTVIIKYRYRYVIKFPRIKNPLILNANPFLKKSNRRPKTHSLMILCLSRKKVNGRQLVFIPRKIVIKYKKIKYSTDKSFLNYDIKNNLNIVGVR